jgi:multidrug efflux pump subunit AcrA (membrane-fusion protein)
MKVKSKTLFIVSFSLIIIAIFIVFSISKPQKADFITLKRQDFKYTILANCTVDYPKPLDIKSTSESLVKAIYKKEGEKVKKGEIIILLDDSEEIRRLKIASNNIISLNKKIKNIKNVELPNLYEKEKELKLELELAKK